MKDGIRHKKESMVPNDHKTIETRTKKKRRCATRPSFHKQCYQVCTGRGCKIDEPTDDAYQHSQQICQMRALHCLPVASAFYLSHSYTLCLVFTLLRASQTFIFIELVVCGVGRLLQNWCAWGGAVCVERACMRRGSRKRGCAHAFVRRVCLWCV